MRKFALALALSVALGGCVVVGPPPPDQVGVNNATSGTLIGAGLGGLIGNQLGHGAGRGAATAAGVVAGALIGHAIGQSLDEADQAAVSRTTQTALEGNQPNQPLPWQGQDGAHGTVVPGQYYQAESGDYCRAFQQTIVIDGATQQGFGKACRQPDGTWRIVE